MDELAERRDLSTMDELPLKRVPAWRRLLLWALPLVLAPCALLLLAGEILSAPAHRPVGPPPADVQARSVRIAVGPDATVSGWFIQGKAGQGAVLLLHGVRSDRRQMLGRARFLAAAGYSVLSIDLQAHGESTGSRITFGAREAQGVSAALRFLRAECPGERLGVVGASLGAASLVLARPQPAPDAVVLEAMFPTIEEAAANRLRMRFGTPGELAVPALLAQLRVRLGVAAQELRPIEGLAALKAPVFILSGARDQHTTQAQTLRLFEAASHPKELWLVQGAGHVDLHAFDPAAYETRVAAFLRKHLQLPH